MRVLGDKLLGIKVVGDRLCSRRRIIKNPFTIANPVLGENLARIKVVGGGFCRRGNVINPFYNNLKPPFWGQTCWNYYCTDVFCCRGKRDFKL